MADPTPPAAQRLEQRKNLMLTALSVLQLQWREEPPPVVADVRKVLGSWTGVGALVTGLNAQGYDVELVQHSQVWRANVFFSGPLHSHVQGTGSASKPTPWEALQHAAWEALTAPERKPGH